ncbi:MAG: glycoside hydrolase family 13 protein [Bacteroidetes bacterium]|nr:glycoside hydrolase family 13 protein [Bacteroidota bacterium]
MNKLLFLILSVFIANSLSAEDIELKRIEPPNWWVGMKNPNLQLLVYGKNIAKTTPEINHPGIELKEVKRTDNPNYLFLNLTLKNELQAGNMTITFTGGEKKILHEYFFKKRREGSAQRKGFDASEVMYLLMPDRFANGDTLNDNMPGMTEKADRNNKNGRHGGDIKGISNHLDYLKDLGIKSLWINPVVENNNPEFSYHGYAITNFYKTDPRYGTNEDYVKLIKSCHDKGMKVVMDMVFNHCSVHHWFIRDLPSDNWIHQFDDYTRSNFRAATTFDPYASDYDQERMLTGWFDVHMTDLNQKNKNLATYLIQNSIWWIEYADLDGIRVDTQPYSYKEFLSQWGEAIFKEYPNFNVVGESWLHKEAFVAYFQEGTKNFDGYNSHIPSVTDFPMKYALSSAFNEKDGWLEGIARFYYVHGQDFLYGDPQQLLVFADNHDLDRIYSSLKNNFASWKMAMALMLTTRGIPCIYYGTELLMEGLEHDGHGFIREDFPGGWPNDPRNAFNKEERTARENAAYEYLHKLIKWRNSRSVIHSGKFKHFIPENNTYVYFRYSDNECTMVAFNNNPNEMKALDAIKYKECLDPYTYAINVITGEPVYFMDSFTIPPKSVLILDFKK